MFFFLLLSFFFLLKDEMHLWINKINSILGQAPIDKTKSLPPPDKRTTSSSNVQSTGAGTTGSLKKDFSKK